MVVCMHSAEFCTLYTTSKEIHSSWFYTESIKEDSINLMQTNIYIVFGKNEHIALYSISWTTTKTNYVKTQTVLVCKGATIYFQVWWSYNKSSLCFTDCFYTCLSFLDENILLLVHHINYLINTPRYFYLFENKNNWAPSSLCWKKYLSA